MSTEAPRHRFRVPTLDAHAFVFRRHLRRVRSPVRPQSSVIPRSLAHSRRASPLSANRVEPNRVESSPCASAASPRTHLVRPVYHGVAPIAQEHLCARRVKTITIPPRRQSLHPRVRSLAPTLASRSERRVLSRAFLALPRARASLPSSSTR